MAANKKLTPLLAGRTVRAVSQIDALATFSYSDGSALMIKTGSPLARLDFQDRRVLKVRQTGTLMNLDFEDGTSAEIALAEAMSSVLLRDKDGRLEYAD
jgi:hypothetical protein